MGKTSRKKSEPPHKPRKRVHEIVEGIIWRPEEERPSIAEKIIFLGKENLEKLRGYKAFLDLWSDGELCITLTGLSLESAGALFNALEEMKDEEVHGM